MNATTIPRKRMKVSEFLAWAEGQPHGRYELVDGEIVAMAPERVRHNQVKLAVARSLEDAVRKARLDCTVFTDGVAVAIDDYTTREPDASVQRGIAANLDSMVIEAPMIVVDVSPSSERNDTDAKLIEYFSVASIQHYLIVLPEKRAIVHHQKNEGAAIITRIAHEGELALAPPGLSVAVTALLGPSEAARAEDEGAR